MEKIDNTIEKLNSLESNNIKERIVLIKELNEMIDCEQNKLKNMLDIDNYEPICHKKYKKYTIDELYELWNNNDNIDNSIMIYQTFCYKLNEIMDELFDNNSDDNSDDNTYYELDYYRN